MNLREWNVASREHFPKLQRLVLRDYFYLEEIPSEIGEISMLESLIESTRKIEQEQRDMGNEELNIIMFDIDQVCDDM